MMEVRKSGQWAKWKHICALFVMTAVAIAFAQTAMSNAFVSALAAQAMDVNAQDKPVKAKKKTDDATIGDIATEGALFFIDGKKATNEAIDKLDPSKIENISVLKEGAAVEAYGEAARNGVIMITLKKAKGSAKKTKE